MNCQQCFTEIENKIVYCPECGLPYHEECWRKNNSKCTVYGCKGSTVIIEEVDKPENETEVDIIENKLQDTNSLLISRKSQKINKTNVLISILVAVIVSLLILLFYYQRNTQISYEKNEKTELNNLKGSLVSPVNNSTEVLNDKKVLSSASTEPIIKEPAKEVHNYYSSTPHKKIETKKAEENNQKTEVSSETKDKIKNIILDWRNLKVKIYRNPEQENSEVYSYLTGKALEDVLGGLKWDREHNEYKDITPFDLHFEEITAINDNKVNVIVKISEKADFYKNGNLLSKYSYNSTYRAKYTLDFSNSNWFISSMNAIKK